VVRLALSILITIAQLKGLGLKAGPFSFVCFFIYINGKGMASRKNK